MSAAEVGLRLDVFLASPERLGSRRQAATALERGKVFLNGAEVGPPAASQRLRSGDQVRFWIDRPGSAHARHRARQRPGASGRIEAPSIVYEDDVLVVVDKPAGLLTVPLASRGEALSVSGVLDSYLRSRGRRRVFPVHRLDRDTSGIVVFATDPSAERVLKEQFVRREPERIYLTVVRGTPTPPIGEWRDWLRWDATALIQKPARPGEPRAHEGRTKFEVVESLCAGAAALLRVTLITGKRNQIRVQAQLHGHPLLGERLYVGSGVPEAELGVRCERQALHASRLVFRHPKSGRRMAFEAPLPADMTRLLGQLREAKARTVRPVGAGVSPKR